MGSKKYLNDKKVNKLFSKYSFPLTKISITPSQKEKFISISMILWLFLVKGEDTEKNVYLTLKELVRHDDQVSNFGAIYFHRMKKALSEKDIQKLKKYYSDPENFKSLKERFEPTFLKWLH